MTRRWVVWFKDGRYSYAFGETAEDARCNYLREWSEGIARVAPAGEHRDQLPPQNYVPMSRGKQMPDDHQWP